MPEILSRKVIQLSPWVRIVEKTIRENPGGAAAVYHFVAQEPYVGMLVQLPDRRIAIVRQYRVCVEEYTWELPAGTVAEGETPEQAALREVREETGLEPLQAVYLGNFQPDTGRLAIDSHVFYVQVAQSAPLPEPGIEVRLVTHDELKAMMRGGEFRHQLHLAAYASVLLAGINLD